MIPADALSSTSSPASAEAIPCRCPGSGASCNARWRISVEHPPARGAVCGTPAGAWDIRRHVEHCRGVEHRGAHQGRFHSPRCFSEARVRRKGSGAHGESTCQSTTATVRPALLHRNFEAALRTASVGVFARLRVISKTCI